MIAKLLGTGFGVLTVMFAYYWQTAYWSLRANTANNFKEMGESMELSAGVQQFVNNFASAEPVTAPGMIVILFDLIVLAMILVTIWVPKNSSDYIVLNWGGLPPNGWPAELFFAAFGHCASDATDRQTSKAQAMVPRGS